MQAKSRPFYLNDEDPPARREILRAALKLFSEKGLTATSIRDIAAESGYTNPALYKHFSSKEDLALYLFETCHHGVWTRCNAAMTSVKGFNEKLDRYVGEWLDLIDEHPDVIAFLSDSARELWPKAGPSVRRQTMIGLAHTLASAAKPARRAGPAINPYLAAASLQGTLSELARMLQVGVLAGPASKWKGELVAQFHRLLA